MTDMTTIATALADYVTDNGIFPKQDGIFDESSELYTAVVPKYLNILPIKDAWGENFRIYCGDACKGKYGITDMYEFSFLIVSFGKDKEMESLWEYNPSDEEAGYVTVYSIEDYNTDLVNYDGSWIRGPLYKDGKRIGEN